MFKKAMALVLTGVLLVSAAACGEKKDETTEAPTTKAVITEAETTEEETTEEETTAAENTVAPATGDDVSCVIGETYDTEWFQFTIESAEEVDSYAGYSPAEGNRLIDVVITEKSTFPDSAVPLGTADFYMDAASFSDYVYPMEPLDDTMMPEEFELELDDSVTYHMVYEIPGTETEDLMLLFTEFFEDDSEGATFVVDLSDLNAQ